MVQTVKVITAKLQIDNLPQFANQDFVQVNVLRLDKVHNIVSGNKWFKLKYYFQDAQQRRADSIITFGGAYSNHIVATAFACKKYNLKCIGIIRGEKPKQLSHTLQNAIDYGMELIFVSRSEYEKKIIPEKVETENVYVIPEGGYGNLGSKGFATVFDEIDYNDYTHIICACGTGTTLAGIIQKALPRQKIIGINVLKGYEKIDNDIIKIMDDNSRKKPFTILNNYHFGGYAKKNAELISYMNYLWLAYKLPTDFVYTTKLFYAVNDLINKNYFEKASKLLLIHSGGLQGNLSSTKNELLF